MHIFICTAVFCQGQKIHGVSLVNPPRPIGPEKMADVTRIAANWVSVIPYGFSIKNDPYVSFDNERQWWGERTDGTCALIQMAKAQGLKVMLKPHVWIVGEGWAGDFNLTSEEEWKIWEDSYSKYILHHARVADSLDVDILCLGTEYRMVARDRPGFWRQLIHEVRRTYGGALTYAANWDNFQQINWWSEVDFIGIDAYFPLVESLDPSTMAIKKGWEPMKQLMANFSKQLNMPILFTEYGFQSVDGACGKHWEVDKSQDKVNYALQARAYNATFQCFMNEDWYVGGFLWKWHFFNQEEDRLKTAWTPQNKPAEQIIAEWYSKIK